MKRSFLLLLVLAILFTGIAVVQAEDVAATPDAFVRRYDVYLPQGFTHVMTDNNWYNEMTLDVVFESTRGPQLIGIWITCTNKTTNEVISFDMLLSVSHGDGISLPWAGNCTFKIDACSFDVAGNVTIKVSLQ